MFFYETGLDRISFSPYVSIHQYVSIYRYIQKTGWQRKVPVLMEYPSVKEKRSCHLRPSPGTTIKRKFPAINSHHCALAIKLEAKCLLESSSLSGGHSRYSILLVDEAFRILQQGDICYRRSSKGEERINHQGEDILHVLQKMASYHSDIDEEFPVPAGGLGFLSFEFAAYCDDIPFSEREDALGLPLGEFLFGHVMLIFDHYTDEITLIGLNYPGFKWILRKLLRMWKQKSLTITSTIWLNRTGVPKEHYCRIRTMKNTT